MRRRLPIALLVAAALPLAACGDDAKEPVVSTTADGTVVAELETASGDAWTVTLPEGATEAYDLYGNDGREPISIRLEDAGPVSAAPGGLFAIGLRQQGGTGYSWRPIADAWTPVEEGETGPLVELVEQGVNPHDPGEGVPGGEETHYYVYRAVVPGSGTIEFGLFGPGAEEPERMATMAIEVS